MLFNQLPTISLPLAGWWRTNCQSCCEQYMQEFLFLDGKGKENYRRFPLHSAIFGIAEEFIQAALYLWSIGPTGFMSLKGYRAP